MGGWGGWKMTKGREQRQSLGIQKRQRMQSCGREAGEWYWRSRVPDCSGDVEDSCGGHAPRAVRCVDAMPSLRRGVDRVGRVPELSRDIKRCNARLSLTLNHSSSSFNSTQFDSTPLRTSLSVARHRCVSLSNDLYHLNLLLFLYSVYLPLSSLASKLAMCLCIPIPLCCCWRRKPR